MQKPEKKPRSILVLKFKLQQCGKNIITDFIGDKVLGEHLHYTTSDLEKILRRFNSAIQARKLIVMNETRMSSGDWHRFNRHLKSLITEGMVTIECKGLESKRLKDFAGYMVTSNQDAPLKIDIGDSRVICFDVFSRCRGNTAYFKRLGKVLNHPDAPGVVMKYLFSLDLSDFEPQEIPVIKMKSDIMRDQLPNPIRFIINYITSRAEDSVVELSKKALYQKYLEWCGEDGEKPFSNNNIAGKKFSDICIESKQARIGGGKREWQYILDRFKIVAKLCESGLGDMEEFSDISQDDLPENETTDIPIFNVSKTISQKIILPQPECHNRVADRKNAPPSKDKKADKQDELTQLLFDYVAKDIRAPVASTCGTSETSKTPEPVIDGPETSKHPESNELICEVVNTPSKEINVKRDSSKPINEVSFAILLARAQRDERLRKRAVELGEDPDVFVTITEKDRFDSITFRDRMEMDLRMCGWAIETEDNPKEHIDMTVRERLIGEEIIRHSLEDDGIITWKKTVSILQENGMLW